MRLVHSSEPGDVERNQAIWLLAERVVLASAVCQEMARAEDYDSRRPVAALDLLRRWVGQRYPATGETHARDGLDGMTVPEGGEQLMHELRVATQACEDLAMLLTADTASEYSGDKRQITQSLAEYQEVAGPTTSDGGFPWGDADDRLYTRRYAEALKYAAIKHRNQARKGSGLPYLTHLMAVSMLVWEHGGDEDQAIAGLLHDAVEDCGGAPILKEIRILFGDRVAGIVDAATDSATTRMTEKAPWWERKTRHIAGMAQISPAAALVIACDKLHNLAETAEGYLREGEEVFAKFNPEADTRWYYRQMRDALAPKLPSKLLAEIDRNLETIGA